MPARPLRCLITITALALSAGPLRAQTGTVESIYVVLGGDGAIARAILSNASQCPTIRVGNDTQPMRVRAQPNDAFAVLVCEAAIPAGATAGAIAGRRLPLPKARLNMIVTFGDTGCRLEDGSHGETGRFQSCDNVRLWPFPRLARSVAARRPDLVVHVGDYYYRESACPAADAGCKGSPHGDNWPTWKADFFAPAAPLLAVAPWIVTRGNHENCSRGGAGYFRFLAPSLATDDTPPACVERMPVYTASAGGKDFIVMDTGLACDARDCDSAAFATQFAGIKPKPGSWFVTHRPVWGIGRNFTLNTTLQQALAGAGGRLPDGITLALAGHMHIFEALSFTDNRPPMLVVGTGGTALDKPITRRLAGMTLGTATVRRGRVEHGFGYTLLRPAGRETWRLTFTTVRGGAMLSCRVTPTDVRCG